MTKTDSIIDLAIQSVAVRRRELAGRGADVPTFRDFPQVLLQVEEAVRRSW
jgi:hypothetical protein